jgi:hypothetical protein
LFSLPKMLYCLPPVLRLADNLQALLASQHTPETLPHEAMVVGYDDPG